MAFPFCASSVEASVCFANCGHRASTGVGPRPAITPMVERMSLQHNSQLEKGGGEGWGGKCDIETFKTISSRKSLCFPTASADKGIQGGFSLPTISCLRYHRKTGHTYVTQYLWSIGYLGIKGFFSMFAWLSSLGLSFLCHYWGLSEFFCHIETVTIAQNKYDSEAFISLQFMVGIQCKNRPKTGSSICKENQWF